MSIAAWLGIGGCVLALVVAVQTLRLKSAQRDAAAARAQAADTALAYGAAEDRIEKERAISQRWENDYRQIHDALNRELAELDRQKETVERQRDEVERAATDDNRLIAVLRRSLGAGGTLPESRPTDPPDRSDEPV